MTTSRHAMRSRRPPAVALAAFLLAAFLLATSASAQNHWLVDAAGGGDFTDLQAAIDAAAAGDVLLVAPGDYGAALLGKQLAVLGDPAGPRPIVESLEVLAAPAFTLTHLELRRVRVADVPQRSVIDACKIGDGCFADVLDVVHVSNAGDLLLSRCELVGSGGALGIACRALRVRGGVVQIVGSSIHGTTGVGPPGPHAESHGEIAVRLEDGARAWIAGSTLHGGDTGSGIPGAAMVVASGAQADVRGTASDQLIGGKSFIAPPGGLGVAIQCAPGAGVVVGSGAVVVGSVGGCTQLHPGSAAPFLETGGADGPGLVREVAVTGAAGSMAVLAIALGAGALELPWLATTPLWLAPGSELALLPLALGGPGAPAVVALAQPPTAVLAGVQVHVQAFELLVDGTLRGTNAAALVLTW